MKSEVHKVQFEIWTVNYDVGITKRKVGTMNSDLGASMFEM